MTKILITGISGFVGSHLANHILQTQSAELHGTILVGTPRLDTPNIHYHFLDLRDALQVEQLIDEIRPDHIYHLAAQAFVPQSFEAPWGTLENNIRGQLNIIQACLSVAIEPRMLVVSSAEIYGIVQPDELPLTEDAPLRPTSPYSVSKVTQDMLALQYHLSHQLPIMRARPFNHFGPGQNERFVAPAFATQIAQIEAGHKEPVIHVGNLEAKRDFTDVRDIVRAYTKIIEKGEPGAVYNVASGVAHSIQELLDTLLSYSGADICVQTDPDRLRPVHIPILQGDATRLCEATGWQPQIPFEQSLQDILEDHRERVGNSA